MEQEHAISIFKEMLAQAIFLGSTGAECAYRGLIESPENEELLSGINTLYDKVETFIGVCAIEGLSAADVFPLQTEIEVLTKND